MLNKNIVEHVISSFFSRRSNRGNVKRTAIPYFFLPRFVVLRFSANTKQRMAHSLTSAQRQELKGAFDVFDTGMRERVGLTDSQPFESRCIGENLRSRIEEYFSRIECQSQ